MLSLAACAPSEPVVEQPTTADDKAAIEQLRADYVEAYNAADVDALVDLFTADAVNMAPNEPSTGGAAGLRNMFETQFEQVTAEVSVNIGETQIAGDWAYSRGSYKLTVTPKEEGEPVEDNGKWLNILQRQADGAWKIHRNIWNSNNPLPETSNLPPEAGE
jgi:uncharacterized protein (TIGR02246 family)